jgi:hypothetical protein
VPGTMSEADLVADLKASLFDAAGVFNSEPGDAAFKRFLRQALPDMQTKRPITRLGSVQLQAGTARYEVAEPGFAAFKVDLWREPSRLPKPWDPAYPGPLPRVSATWDTDAWFLVFEPAPSTPAISVLGAEFKFYYFAEHAIGELAAATTINPQDRGLLLLRAQVEAMLALAMRNSAKPVQLRDGLSGMPRNSTPAALHEILLRTFREYR